MRTLRRRPALALYLVLVVVLLQAAIVAAGVYAGRASVSRPMISQAYRRPQVERLFDLGTGGYRGTACSGHRCAWEYAGDGWRVVLFLDTTAEAAHGPPMTP